MEKYKNLIENKLKEYFTEYGASSSYSKSVWEAMSYTTLLGGKRLRAIITLEIARLFGADIETALPSACAMEMMHAYSLIHDDLPCMDNDDLRRGKPTNHKVFGEAIALLAGDALISFGAQIIIDKTNASKETILDIVKDYLVCAGAQGIIAGQVADIQAENKKINIDNLKYIHKYKTGALFKCSVVTGAKLAGADTEIINKLENFADDFGMLFQIYDDIIDCTLTTQQLGKTAGKDKIENKLTYVSAYGLDEAKKIFYTLVDKNYAILKELKIKSSIFEKIYSSLIDKIK